MLLKTVSRKPRDTVLAKTETGSCVAVKGRAETAPKPKVIHAIRNALLRSPFEGLRSPKKPFRSPLEAIRSFKKPFRSPMKIPPVFYRTLFSLGLLKGF